MVNNDSLLREMRRVLQIEARAVSRMAEQVGHSHAQVLDMLYAAKGRVILTGVGKSGHIAQKAAATFASTGTPAQYVHAGDASHGDLGMIGRDDVCIALSNSGESAELAEIVTYTRRFSIPLIAITGAPRSTLAMHADTVLALPDIPEACPIGVAPTTSTTASLALCDALAVALMVRRGFRSEDFQVFHPGGKLGSALLRVDALMHQGARLPLVPSGSNMRDWLLAMTAAGFGIMGVMGDDGRLVGVITDGDLRRHMDGLLDRDVDEVASRAPKTIQIGTLAFEALGMMNAEKITAVFVVDDAQKVVGIVHIHDCLRAGII